MRKNIFYKNISEQISGKIIKFQPKQKSTFKVTSVWLSMGGLLYLSSNPYRDDDELFCGIGDRWKTFSLISSRDHCQSFSPSQIFDTRRAGLESALNLSSGFVELSCTIIITTTTRRRKGLRQGPVSGLRQEKRSHSVLKVWTPLLTWATPPIWPSLLIFFPNPPPPPTFDNNFLTASPQWNIG